MHSIAQRKAASQADEDEDDYKERRRRIEEGALMRAKGLQSAKGMQRSGMTTPTLSIGEEGEVCVSVWFHRARALTLDHPSHPSLPPSLPPSLLSSLLSSFPMTWNASSKADVALCVSPVRPSGS